MPVKARVAANPVIRVAREKTPAKAKAAAPSRARNPKIQLCCTWQLSEITSKPAAASQSGGSSKTTNPQN
jgi:hypothetical protein